MKLEHIICHRASMRKVEYDNDSLEQYSRRNSLRISGLPENPTEKTDELIIDLASEFNVTLNPDDSYRSPRVGKIEVRRRLGSKQDRDTLVKFSTYNARHRFTLCEKTCETEKI